MEKRKQSILQLDQTTTTGFSGTTIADAEIVYDEIPTKLVYMKFIVKDTSNEIIIASTRPELLCACKTVIVNPDDSRYAELIGKKLDCSIN